MKRRSSFGKLCHFYHRLVKVYSIQLSFELEVTSDGYLPSRKAANAAESPPPPRVFSSVITLEQFRIQSSNYTTFPKILWAIFQSVFQHYPRSPAAMVTNNLEGTFSIFEYFLLCQLLTFYNDSSKLLQTTNCMQIVFKTRLVVLVSS